MFVLGRVPCGGTALGFPTPWEPFCNVRLFSLSGVLPFALSRKRFSRPCPEGLFGCVSRFRPRIALLECVSRRGSGRLSGCVSRRGSGSPAVRGPASEPEPRLFLPETSCPGVLRRRACDPAMRDIYIKIVSIWPVRVPYRNRLYGFMSICYNFWVLIFRCLSVVLHSVSDCNPWAADARSVLSRWGGCPGALSGRVPKLFGPFCGPTEGCRAFCGGAHAGADGTRRGRGPIARLCLPCARMGAMTKKTRRTFV